MRYLISSELHASCLKVVEIKMLARSYTRWSKMNAALKKIYINNCENCKIQLCHYSPENFVVVPATVSAFTVA